MSVCTFYGRLNAFNGNLEFANNFGFLSVLTFVKSQEMTN